MLPFECGFAALCALKGRATAPIDVRRGVCSTAKSPRQNMNAQWAVCRRSTARYRRGSRDTEIDALRRYLSNAVSLHHVPNKGVRRLQSTSDAV